MNGPPEALQEHEPAKLAEGAHEREAARSARDSASGSFGDGGPEAGPRQSRIERWLLLAGTLLPSPARIALLRALGHHVGKGARISLLTVLCARRIWIDEDARIGPLNIILSGSEVRLGDSSEVSFMVIISGRGSFHLGARSYVSVQTFIDLEGGVTIGRYSGTGPRTMIFTHAIYLPPSQGYPRVVRPTRLGDYVWLGGMNFVTAGVVVGDRVMTAPGAVISRRIGPDVFWVGPDRQLPMERIRRRMTRRDLAALADEIVRDYAAARGAACVVEGETYTVGDRIFVIGSSGGCAKAAASAVLLLDESAEGAPDIPWYHLVTLRCADACAGSFHEAFQRHLRKYFGMHFLPESRDDGRVA